MKNKVEKDRILEKAGYWKQGLHLLKKEKCYDVFMKVISLTKSSTQKEIDELIKENVGLLKDYDNLIKKFCELEKQLSEAEQTERERIIKLIAKWSEPKKMSRCNLCSDCFKELESQINSEEREK